MSTTIDREVVEMRFDNKDFEKNAATSMSTLDKLKNAIKFENLAHPFSKISDTIKGVSFDPMLEGIGAVQAKFSMLDIAVATIVQNITNSILGMAKKITNEFAIAPITTGLQEYETQINAVQTILSNTKSKGTTIDDVNEALDELNHYADKTIYNFTQMTDNIGRFTAAGLDLNTSVSAIQGIANLAAMSGSTSQQASTAMYQLSQALSSGTVKLQDWNSVVNAGMGGELFQEQLKMTSREMVGMSHKMQAMYKDLDPMGTKFEETAKIISDKFNISLKDTEDILKNGYDFNVDEIIEKKGSYRESLSTGWITSSVLAKTLDRLTTSGAISYIGEHLQENSKYTLENVEAMYKEAMAAKNADEEIKKLAKTIASSTDLTEEQINSVLNMAMTAEDAATKVKTFTQLMDTLKEAVQSGWTQSWEIIIGDFEEAREFWSMVSDRLGEVIAKTADARNAMLQAWADAGGRQDLIDSLFNIFDAIENFTSPVKEAIETLFPPMTSEKLLNITNGFKAFTESLILNEEAQSKLRDTIIKVLEPLSWMVKYIGEVIAKTAELGVFKDIWISIKNVALTIANVFSAISNAIANVFFDKDLDNMEANVASIAGFIKSITEKIREFTEMLKISSEDADKISNIFESILRIANIIKSVIFEAISRLAAFVSDHLYIIGEIKDHILEIVSAVGEWINQHIRAKEILDGIKTLFNTIGDIASKALEKIGNIIDVIKEKLSDIFSKFKRDKDENSDGGFFSGTFNTIKKISKFIKDEFGPLMSKLVDGIKQINWKAIFGGLVTVLNWQNINKIIDFFFGEKNLSGILSNLTESFFGPLSEALSGFGDVLSEFKSSIKVNELIKIAAAIGILALSLSALAKIDSDSMTTGIAGITSLFAELIAATKLLNVGDALGVNGLLEIAVSIGILAMSLSSLAKFDPDKLGGASSAIISMMTALVIVTKLLSSSDPKSIVDGMSGLIVFAVSVSILASAVKKLAKLDPGAMELACASVMLLVLTFAAVSKNLGSADLSSISESAVGMLLFSFAVLTLANAVKMLAKLDATDLMKGLLAVGSILLEMSLFLKSSGIGDIGKGAAGMILFATGIVIMAAAVKMLAKLDLESLARGLIGIGGILLGIGLFANYLEKTNLPAIGAGLLIIGTSFVIMAAAMKIFASIDLDGIVKGLIAITGVFLSLAVFAESFKKMNLAAIGAGLLVVAIAFITMSAAFKILATISAGDMLKSLATIAVSLALLSASLNFMKGTLSGSAALLVAAIALSGLVPPILILGSLSLATIAKGIIALAGGLAVLITAATFAQAAAVGILILSGAMLALGASVLMMGAGITMIGAGLTLLNAQALIFKANFLATIVAILAAIPLLVKGLVSFFKELFVEISAAIEEIVPAIKRVFVVILNSICETIIECGPTLSKTIIVLVQLVFSTVMSLSTEIIDFIGNIITDILEGITKFIPEWVVKMIDIAVALIEGLGEGLSEAGPKFREALISFFEGLLEFILGFFGIHSPSTVFAEIGVNLILGLIEGIGSMFADAIQSIGSFITGIIDTIKDFVTGFFDAAVTLLGEFLSGLGEKAVDIYNAAAEIGSKTLEFLLGKKEEYTYGGITLASNFAEGIKSKNDSTKKSGEDIANSANKGVDSAKGNFETSGSILGQNAAKGISSQASAARTSGAQLASSGQSGVLSASTSYNSAGSNLGSAASSGLGSKSGSMRTQGSVVATAGKEGAASTRSEYESTGAYLSDGLAVGFGSRTSNLITKVKTAAKAADTEARKTLGINSPSKVFAEIGRYTMEGFVVGIEKYSDKVGIATSNVAKDSIDAMNSAIGAIATISEEDMDANPVITPVLDLSNIESEAGRIPSLLDTLNTYTLASQNGSLINVGEEVKKNNSESLANEIMNLRRDFNNLINAINGLEIVMDTGTVAGELTPSINKNLGTGWIMSGRGI